MIFSDIQPRPKLPKHGRGCQIKTDAAEARPEAAKSRPTLPKHDRKLPNHDRSCQSTTKADSQVYALLWVCMRWQCGASLSLGSSATAEGAVESFLYPALGASKQATYSLNVTSRSPRYASVTCALLECACVSYCAPCAILDLETRRSTALLWLGHALPRHDVGLKVTKMHSHPLACLVRSSHALER